MKKLLFRLLLTALVIAGLARLAMEFPLVQDRALRQLVTLGMRQAAEGIPQPDSLQAYICGSSSPLPAPDRAQACVAIMTPRHLYIVDSGAGSTSRVMQGRLPLNRLQGVLITHLHSDHIAEIPELNLNSWIAGRPLPLRVYGPRGIRRLVSALNRAYEADRSYRVLHHGEDLLPPALGELGAERVEPGVIIEDGDLIISAYRAEHDPVKPAYGYRFDYRGRSIVVSGDSNVTDETHRISRNLDLLLHDALSEPVISAMSAAAGDLGLKRNSRILADVLDYHAWTSALVEFEEKTPVGMVALYHLVPAPQNILMEWIMLRQAPENFVIADDRDWFELPTGSRDILVR